MDITFVTCVYTNLFNTEFGGRINFDNRYKFGLISLFKMNSNFIIYTWKKDVDNLINFLNENKPEDYNSKFLVLGFDLNESPVYNDIKKIKNVENQKKSERSYDLMINKFIFVSESIKNNYFDSDYFFWIDAGLSHCCLFPNKYMITNEGGWKQFSDCVLFSSELKDSLKKFDKVLLFRNNSQYADGDYYSDDWYIIGGMWGGNKKNTNWFCDLITTKFLYEVNINKKLYLDEALVTKIVKQDQSNFDFVDFDLWHHENSGDWVQDIIKGKKSFYKFFEEKNNLK